MVGLLCQEEKGGSRIKPKEECAIYIAIDGGGTKTEYLLLNESFMLVDSLTGGGSNHERLADGYEGVRREFEESLSALLARNGAKREDVRDVVAGLAGADNSAQVKRLEDVLHGLGFARALVCNDGYLPVRASCDGGVGIAYNCGTGVCCTAIDPQGKMTKIGGLDEWADDAGGGVWILQQVFARVYDDVALSLGKTALAARYAQALGLAQSEMAVQLDESLQTVKDDPAIQRRLIAALFEASDSGDAAAQAITRRMITRAADYIGAAYRQSDFGGASVQVVLCGSILLKAASERYLDAMKAAVRQRLGVPVQWLAPRQSAAHGAVVWLQKRNQA